MARLAKAISWAGAAVSMVVAACGGERFELQAERDAAPDGGSGTSPVLEAGAADRSGGSGGTQPSGGNAGVGAGGSGAGGSAGDSAPPQPVALQVEIQSDSDDATWINGSDERLFYSADERHIEVGADAEMARLGLRFALPVPPRSAIQSARLKLTRVSGTASASESMRVQVFDSVAVAPFADAHQHPAEAHDPGGILPTAVTAFRAGSDESIVESPELKELVQHLVDKAGWTQGSAIGFVLSVDSMTAWAGFADSSSGSDRASLSVVYTPRAL